MGKRWGRDMRLRLRLRLEVRLEVSSAVVVDQVT
jgi:hypothetical protein